MLKTIALTAILAVAPANAFSADNCLSANNPEQLKKYKGHYLATSILEDIKSTKNISIATKKWPSDVFSQGISVTEVVNPTKCQDVVTGTNWHETEALVGVRPNECLLNQKLPKDKCVSPNGSDKLDLKVNGKVVATYQKIPAKAEAHLFNQLFAGCYKDVLGKSVCFKNNAVEMSGKRQKVDLLLDSFELAGEGNYLRFPDNTLWLLMPNDGGWKVYKTTYSSVENYKPVELNQPWKRLTRKDN